MTKALLALVMLTAPALADDRLAGGYMMSLPVAGSAGGADHAVSLRFEHDLRADLDLGLAVAGGHAPGNTDESLTRVAVLPTLGMRGMVGALDLRADVALGWQLAHGTTNVGGVPVRGTEARGVRAELGVAISSRIAKRVALRARGGLGIDGVYPRGLPSSTRLGPLVEIDLVLGL